VLGESGYNDWGTSKLNEVPPAGVIGFSGTGNIGGGSTTQFDPPPRKGRIGVAGVSYRNAGVWGMTHHEGSFGSTVPPDSIKAGVVGYNSTYLPAPPSGEARFDHWGVAGLNPDQGSGVLGIGSGHGIVGYGGSKTYATSAGVWGNTRFGTWAPSKRSPTRS
jgi:hypothetical protein